jgi:hypothetical protein
LTPSTGGRKIAPMTRIAQTRIRLTSILRNFDIVYPSSFLEIAFVILSFLAVSVHTFCGKREKSADTGGPAFPEIDALREAQVLL